MSSSFLVFVPLPADRGELGERLVRSAVCFLEAQGLSVGVDNHGRYLRGGRGGGELLTLVALTTESAVADADELARALEGVLRSTAVAAKVRAGDVRVFVRAAQGETSDSPMTCRDHS